MSHSSYLRISFALITKKTLKPKPIKKPSKKLKKAKQKNLKKNKFQVPDL